MSGERVQGPHLLKQTDFKAGRVLVRVWGEDGSWGCGSAFAGWNKSSFAAPASPQAPHGPPSTLLGQGAQEQTPKKYRVNEGGFRAPWLGNKNIQNRLNSAFVIPLFLTCYLHFHHGWGKAYKCSARGFFMEKLEWNNTEYKQKFQTRWMSLSVRCHSVRLKAICHPWISLSAPSLSFSLTLLGHLFTVDLPDK